MHIKIISSGDVEFQIIQYTGLCDLLSYLPNILFRSSNYNNKLPHLPVVPALTICNSQKTSKSPWDIPKRLVKLSFSKSHT